MLVCQYDSSAYSALLIFSGGKNDVSILLMRLWGFCGFYDSIVCDVVTCASCDDCAWG